MLDSLGYDKLECRGDLSESLAIGPTSYQDIQDRAGWILQSSEIANWLASEESSILVVNGNSAHHERDSAVSFFSAMLVHALLSSNSVVLHWFCGRNISSGPHIAARSLLGQIVQAGVDHMPIPSAGTPRQLDDPRTVIALLSACITRQLEDTDVYCIFDSVSFYESRAWEDEMLLLYRELVAIVETCASKHRLKVLMTSPMQSTYMGTYQDDSDAVILSVPDIVDGMSSELQALAFSQSI